MLTKVLTGVAAEPARIAAVGVAGLALFYVMGLDQGYLLSLIQGEIAFDQNFIHEALHDARHVAGFPCH